MNLFAWYRTLIRGLRRTSATYTTQRVEELPDDLARRTVYLVGSPAWAAALSCPCGCGAIVQLSLLNNDRPRWRLRTDRRGAPTIYPSIWRTQGCRAHFFLRQGRLYWVPAYTTQRFLSRNP